MAKGGIEGGGKKSGSKKGPEAETVTPNQESSLAEVFAAAGATPAPETYSDDDRTIYASIPDATAVPDTGSGYQITSIPKRALKPKKGIATVAEVTNPYPSIKEQLPYLDIANNSIDIPAEKEKLAAAINALLENPIVSNSWKQPKGLHIERPTDSPKDGGQDEKPEPKPKAKKTAAKKRTPKPKGPFYTMVKVPSLHDKGEATLTPDAVVRMPQPSVNAQEYQPIYAASAGTSTNIDGSVPNTPNSPRIYTSPEATNKPPLGIEAANLMAGLRNRNEELNRKAETFGSRFANGMRRTGEWYKRQPLWAKLAIAGALAAGSVMTGGGGAWFWAINAAMIAQRSMGAVSTFVAVEGLLSRTKRFENNGRGRTMLALTAAALVGSGALGTALGYLGHQASDGIHYAAGTPAGKAVGQWFMYHHLNTFHNTFSTGPGGVVVVEGPHAPIHPSGHPIHAHHGGHHGGRFPHGEHSVPPGPHHGAPGQYQRIPGHGHSAPVEQHPHGGPGQQNHGPLQRLRAKLGLTHDGPRATSFLNERQLVPGDTGTVAPYAPGHNEVNTFLRHPQGWGNTPAQHLAWEQQHGFAPAHSSVTPETHAAPTAAHQAPAPHVSEAAPTPTNAEHLIRFGNVQLNPEKINIVLDGNGHQAMFGGSFDDQYSYAQDYVMAHPNSSIRIDSSYVQDGVKIPRLTEVVSNARGIPTTNIIYPDPTTGKLDLPDPQTFQKVVQTYT